MEKITTFNDLVIFLENNFPMCDWSIEVMKYNNAKSCVWYTTDRYKIQIFISKFPDDINNGSYYISLHWDYKNTGGRSNVCESYSDFKDKLKNILTHINPNIFESQQLTLF